MTATSDTHPTMTKRANFDQSKALRSSLQASGRVNHAGRVFFGSVLSISALGMWLVPVESGDAGMQLIKLLVSIVMLALGVMFIFSARNTEALPEIQIDTKTRALIILRHDANGQLASETVHKFDDMNEITLRDGMFSARDASGALIVTLPLPNRAMEHELKSALEIAA